MSNTRRLTIALPVEVWDRLNAEAAEHSVSIRTHLKNLIVARDKRRQDKPR